MNDPAPHRPLDIAERADQLDALADRYLALWKRINERDFLNPAAGLVHLAAYLTDCHILVDETLRRLTELVTSQPSQPLEAGIALTTLNQAIRDSADAASLLARATGQSALTTATWANNYNGVDEQHLQDRYTKASQCCVGAMALLEHSALALHSTALLARSAERQSPAATPRAAAKAQAEAHAGSLERLTPAQRHALQAIAAGGVRLHETVRGSRYIDVGQGPRITLTTYNSLERKGLISRDTSTMLLFHGQRLTITKRGQAALAAITPGRASASPPDTSRPSQGRRRPRSGT
ncbi:hypothetical protein [Streptomyces hainanensis]|uniref:Uncharacterized protein n=1 Tax=Streptomyces hainanensis TaxID=402648 RepID=A0A4R4T0N0_9ACTN|nr:hypothetical protein [Streptomyces hainanensis]TDC70278.1 hypothetical protein E1283_24935 [Streptomyces hainanensis]